MTKRQLTTSETTETPEWTLDVQEQKNGGNDTLEQLSEEFEELVRGFEKRFEDIQK